MGTSIQKIIFQIMKINNFRGELTNNSAKKEALMRWQSTMSSGGNMSLCYSINTPPCFAAAQGACYVLTIAKFVVLFPLLLFSKLN